MQMDGDESSNLEDRRGEGGFGGGFGGGGFGGGIPVGGGGLFRGGVGLIGGVGLALLFRVGPLAPLSRINGGGTSDNCPTPPTRPAARPPPPPPPTPFPSPR